ncbi:MAG TPA: DUF1828 domain-containing protein [Trebonia sp.]|jgi:hypothetical protein|nr:DUF1828 domain-containing protein [Trebonia sp.]
MSFDADQLASSYLSWIRRGVSTIKLDERTSELTTPFLDRHNDHLQIYAERLDADHFLLSDDGYIVSELKSSGVERLGDRRQVIFQDLLSGYGVELAQNELRVEASSSNLGQRVHNLVQAMLSLDDMFVLAQPQARSTFLDVVAKFLDDADVRYSPRAKFAGKSGLDHLVDFVIPKSKEAPERILQVVNSPRRDRVESLLFAANDMRAARGMEISYFALVNDSRREVQGDILNAFAAYDVQVRPWSRREDLVAVLAA